jgi:hypothetical protein
MFGQLGQFGGLKIIESVNCVSFTGKTLHREIPRTWKSRLFTLPWRPWKKTEIISYPETKPEMYRIGDTIAATP